MSSCPNCGGDVTAERLHKGSACSKCIRSEREFSSVFELAEALKEEGTLKGLAQTLELGRRFNAVVEFFKKALGYPPLGPQRAWVLRALRGENFAIIAPPGLGKTTFGLIMSAYFAAERKKSVAIFPTKTIVQQSVERLSRISQAVESELKVLYYHAGLTETQKQETLEALKKDDFDVFLTTSRFLTTNLDLMKSLSYDFLFVDDVDTALKASKSAQAILQMVGFSQEDIANTRELLRQARTDERAFEKIAEIRREKLKGKTVVFSSATITRGNPVLSSLMGFRPGSAVIYLRNVIDAYLKMPQSEEEADEKFVELVKKLGDGVLVFVPVDKGQEKGKALANLLNENGIRAEFVTSESTRKLEEFINGEINVLLGSAVHYGLLVRGIDVPWRVKYAVFYGIPKFKFRIGDVPPPLLVSRVLTILANIREDRETARLAGRVRRKLSRMSPAALAMLSKEIREGKLEDETLKKAYEVVQQVFKDEETLKLVASRGDLIIKGNDLLSPDFLTYVQASGRTSRIYAGSLTTGLSILMVDDDDLFRVLTKRLNIVLEQVNWLPFDLDSWRIGDTPAQEIVSKIEGEREAIIKAKKEAVEPQLGKVKTITFIVESPTKAKTISNFFAKPSVRDMDGLRVYETVIEEGVLNVVASQGHVYDLTTEEKGFYGVEIKKTKGGVEYVPIYNTIKRCANGHQVTYTVDGKCPTCGAPIVMDKSRTIDALRRLVMESDLVLIGTDPDTEGEKIAWDLYLALRPFNPNIKRAEFHEVTRRAITNAIRNPREFNVNLVEAQIVRRIEDRWIGFVLSRKLQTEFWRGYCKKAHLDEKGYSCDENRNLSAGRVQTPVLGWVVKRYEDFNRTKRRVYRATITGFEDFSVLVVRDKERGITKSSQLTIKFEEMSTTKRVQNPLPPYTTDALLADAAQLYRITASETMRIAQDLFESGLITYHRTDSTRISAVGISVAESYLKDSLGEDYKKVFQPRSWGEGGAHEAIRPTRPLDVEKLRMAIEEAEITPAKELTREHFLIYDLIFRRFITSQLAPMELTVETLSYKVYDEEGNEVKLDCDSQDKSECYKTERVVDYSFQGFGKLPETLEKVMVFTPFRLSKPLIPRLKELCGEEECSFGLQITASFLKSDFRLFTEGELVSEMRRKEIGRPSTYATIISTLKRRGYVIASKARKQLVPTPLGKAVYEFLSPSEEAGLGEERKKIRELVSESRTVALLKKMDEIEQGTRYYVDVLNEVYSEISKINNGVT
jgi:reverse gyrase